jgi:hypothetical protein
LDHWLQVCWRPDRGLIVGFRPDLAVYMLTRDNASARRAGALSSTSKDRIADEQMSLCFLPTPHEMIAKVFNKLRYVASRAPHYSEFHRIANFAGNLEALKVAYANGSPEKRNDLLRQFNSIVDQLTMPNGVTKTTYADRLEPSLSAVLSAIQLTHSEIRVLDLPASTGAASLRSLAQLQERYRVTSYVLGDMYHTILYDPRRRCVFDEQGNLIQVAFTRLFFSLYRVGVSGNRYHLLTAALAFPHRLIAWYLRKHYPFRPDTLHRRLLVVHPEVEQLLGQRLFSLQEMDVFRPLPGRYDLILSFHLLHRNYFPPDAVTNGVKNLAASLSEGGLLIVGNTESTVALQKRDHSLTFRLREGNWRSLGIDQQSLI